MLSLELRASAIGLRAAAWWNTLSMNTHARTLLVASVLLGMIALAMPTAANAEYAPRTPCSAAPPVTPILVSPFTGAVAVPLQGNWVEIAAPLDGVPPLDQQRVVLTDSTPYAIDGGTLQLDPGFMWPGALETSASNPMSSLHAVKTWIPALRANTQYTVHIVLPNQGNCVFATLGTFTTGNPE